MDHFVGRSNDAHSHRLSLNRLRGDTFFDASFLFHLLNQLQLIHVRILSHLLLSF